MRLKRVWAGLMIGMTAFAATAQAGLKQGAWRGELFRTDGRIIPFHFTITTEKNKTILYVINAGFRICF